MICGGSILVDGLGVLGILIIPAGIAIIWPGDGAMCCVWAFAASRSSLVG